MERHHYLTHVHRLVVKIGTRMVLRREPPAAGDRLRVNLAFLQGLAD